jgi:hypothetical protein
MERSGQAADLATPHLDDLRALVERRGPFLTLVVSRPDELPKAVADARGALTGTPFADRADEVAAVVEAAFPHAEGVTVVVEPDGIALIEHLDAAPRRPGVQVGPVPMVATILERRAADVPVVLGMVDRTGADLSWSSPHPAGATAQGAIEVDGPSIHIRKIRGGGWSHRRFQQRAEDAWERTAGEVAEEIASAFEEIDARLIVLGGDQRMVQLVCKSLPAPIAAAVREVPGSRAEDGSEDDRDVAAARWMRTAVAEDTVRALELYDQELGQADRAVEGLGATLGALRESRVDLLLVHETDDDARTACFAPEPTLVAETSSELEDLGALDIREGRAVDVAIRAALLTGADVRIVPSTPRLTEGIGAVLRW